MHVITYNPETGAVLSNDLSARASLHVAVDENKVVVRDRDGNLTPRDGAIIEPGEQFAGADPSQLIVDKGEVRFKTQQELDAERDARRDAELDRIDQAPLHELDTQQVLAALLAEMSQSQRDCVRGRIRQAAQARYAAEESRR